jgi:hypothetical protein
VVTWNTDQPTTTALQYGTTTALGTAGPGSSALTTTHSVTLTGLSRKTTYYYQASGQASSGASVTSSVNQFTTAGGKP